MNIRPGKQNQQVCDKIFRFALKIMGSREEAQDLTHDVIEKLLRKGKRNIDEHAGLAMKMTRDLCYDKLRNKKMRQEKLKILGHNSAYYTSTNDNKELVQLTKEIINTLPEKQKLVLHLRDVEGYEFEEISKILETEISAVRMNLSRGRKEVRSQLNKLINHGL